MTDRTLLHQLRRGVGSAIMELKRNPHRPGGRDLVLRCCLKDIGYDPQCEGTKGHYLYTAIAALGLEQAFLPPIAELYQTRLPHRLFEQLTDILHAYLQAGFQAAEPILSAKYAQLKKRLEQQRTFPYRYCEREQFEELMITSMHRGNWRGFQVSVEDAGSILQARQDDACSGYDWFIGCAEQQFGADRVWTYLHEIAPSSPKVQAFLNAVQKEAPPHRQVSPPPITPDCLIQEINAAVLGRRPYGVAALSIRFAREASVAELVDLAARLEAEGNPSIRAQLLRVFCRVDYPRPIAPLLDWVRSGPQDLREAAAETLGRLKDTGIHDLAVLLLTSGSPDLGLTLLKENWKKSDDTLIEKAVLSSRRVAHALQMDIRQLYTKHRSSSSGRILAHVYRNGECSRCRYDIVHAMEKNGVLSQEILLECQYDSYDKTRVFAKKRLVRWGLSDPGKP